MKARRARAWLLTIVRNTYYMGLRDGCLERAEVAFDEELHGGAGELEGAAATLGADPASALLSRDAGGAVNSALDRLPAAFREIVILKEMDDLSYKQIAEIAGAPICTVMSRLARGRKLLLDDLKHYAHGG
ncbi:MAG TPA: hypothetical protein DCW29_22595 [Janthinobacterium sp.]|nr:hypothetical protein [Janthinobacterium sp.]